jgi:hypothetical protein
MRASTVSTSPRLKLWETDVSLSGRVKMLFGGTISPSESSSHAKVDAIA